MSVERKELDLEKAEQVVGGMLDAYVPVGSKTGILTSTKTGQTYLFDAAYIDEVNAIITSSGYEVDKIEKLRQYFV